MKIYCASDFHIGYDHDGYEKIDQFFEIAKEKADMLILCGDILDLWRCPIEKIQNDKKYKFTYKALLSTIKDVQTKYIWGNHDYKLQKILKIDAEIMDEDDIDSIYYCHGWRFDIQQRAGHFLYGWLMSRFPYFYQKFIETPFYIKVEADLDRYKLLSKLIHEEAERFRKKKGFKYLVMGHTHEPLGKGKVFDCGDMIDSFTYVVITDGVPKLIKMK